MCCYFIGVGRIFLKTLIFSHYTVKDIEAEPWKETWGNLTSFAEKMASKFEGMGFAIKLRSAVMDEISQDTLMMANMVTVSSPDLGLKETPIENILGLELDFAPCSTCVTPEGTEFPCRTFKDLEGREIQALPEPFFIETALFLTFKAKTSGSGCGCSSDENSCGCGGSCGSEHSGHNHGCSCGCEN